MNFTDYQRAAMRTARGGANAVYIRAMGLGGEAGEVLDLLKKHLGHGAPLDRVALTAELGDVLWYLATLAVCFDIDLDTVAVANIEKLRVRYPEGVETDFAAIVEPSPPRPGTPDPYRPPRLESRGGSRGWVWNSKTLEWDREPSPLHEAVLRLDLDPAVTTAPSFAGHTVTVLDSAVTTAPLAAGHTVTVLDAIRDLEGLLHSPEDEDEEDPFEKLRREEKASE